MSDPLPEMQKTACDAASAALLARSLIAASLALCATLMSACGVTTRSVAHVDAGSPALRQSSAHASAASVRTPERRGALAGAGAAGTLSASGFSTASSESDATRRRATVRPQARSVVRASTAPEPLASAVAADAGPLEAPVARDPESSGHDTTFELQRLLDSVVLGHIALDVPTAMTVDQKTLIRVVLGMRPAMDSSHERDTASDSSPDGGASVSRIMEARLSGSSFLIDPVTPERQAFAARQSAEWTWLVTPKQAGRQQLHLTVSGAPGGDDSAMRRLFPTLDHTVEVGLTWRDRIRAFVEMHPLGLWAAAAALLLAVLWRRSRSRMKRRRWFHGKL